MSTNLKSEEVEGLSMTFVFNFTDANQQYTCIICNSILDVIDSIAEKWDVKVTTTGETWRNIISQKRNAAAAYFSGDLVVEGGLTTLKEFFGHFDQTR